MSFGSILGSIGKGILGIVPGGSIVNGILDATTKAAPVLSGAAQNQANSRILQDKNQILRDQLTQARYGANEALPGNRLKTSVAASKVANYMPVTANWGGPGSGLRGGIVQFSGGAANPNLISPDVRNQANDVIHQELMKQLNRQESPTISGPTPEGWGDKLLGGAAFGANLLGALRKPGSGTGNDMTTDD